MSSVGKYNAVFHISIALGHMPFPDFGNRALMRNVHLKYSYLSKKFLKRLEDLGIQAQSPQPFAADWSRIIEITRIKHPHVASWLATLIYIEWSFMYWLNRIHYLNIYKEMDNRIHMESAISKIGPPNEFTYGSNGLDLEIKWWIDNLVTQIRASWDKLPRAIAETNIPQIDLDGIEFHSKRVKALARDAHLLELSEDDDIIFNKLIDEFKSIEYIRKHRTNELHLHGQRYNEIFGEPGKHDTLATVWKKVSHEYERAREALIATIGLILRNVKTEDYTRKS